MLMTLVMQQPNEENSNPLIRTKKIRNLSAIEIQSKSLLIMREVNRDFINIHKTND